MYLSMIMFKATKLHEACLWFTAFFNLIGYTHTGLPAAGTQSVFSFQNLSKQIKTLSNKDNKTYLIIMKACETQRTKCFDIK